MAGGPILVMDDAHSQGLFTRMKIRLTSSGAASSEPLLLNVRSLQVRRGKLGHDQNVVPIF